MEAPAYDNKKGLNSFDRLLVRGFAADKSATEVSAMTNGVYSPAAALARVLEILDGRDALSQAHKKMLLTDDLMSLKDVLYEKAVEFKSLDHAKPLIAVLTLIDKRLNEDKFDLQQAMSEISRAHAMLMLQAISKAFERTMDMLEEAHPEITSGELRKVLNESLPLAVYEIESRRKDE